MSRATLAVLVLALGASSLPLFGCSGDAGDGWVAPSSEDESADALSTGSALVPGVAAITFSTKTTHLGNSPGGVESDPVIAAPSKIKKSMAAISKLRPNQPLPACAGPGAKTTRMKFLDANGKELGHGEYSCSVGAIHVGGVDTAIFAKSAAIEAVRALAPLPGDVLFGVDTVTLSRPGHGPSLKVHGDEAKAIVDAIDLETLVPIDPTRPVARCLPSLVLAFQRGQADVASASYMCSNPSASTKVRANFHTSEGAPGVAASGTTTIDPRAVQRIIDAH